MAVQHAIILAAGEGTRMKSDLPKVLHPICGRPMLAYAFDLAAAVGVRQPIVILGHGAEQVKPTLPKEVKAVIQTKQQGTGDAVLIAKKALGAATGNLLILYADTPLLRRTTVQKLIETHGKGRATCTLLAAHLADPSGYGRVKRNETGHIVGIVEEAEAHAADRVIREINVGPLVCDTKALLEALAQVPSSGAKKEIFLTRAIAVMAQLPEAKILSMRVEEISEALGVNSREELARATGVIRQRITDAHLRNGVTIEDPQSTFIDHGVTIGHDTVIRPCTVIETGVSIGRRCHIGPFARVRTGVAIGDDTRVGNFAELVRAKIGARVRINHVSYLGDALVDDEVNIGAGTITANYDGQAKHQTQIGKGAFIGSDTVLIAPVKVGAKAVTGAGSVVPRDHDVPARGVVVGVPARPLDAKPTNGKPAPALPPAARPAVAAKRPAARVKTKTKTKTKTKAKTRPRVAAKKPARKPARRAGGPVRAAKTKTAKRRPARLPARQAGRAGALARARR